MPSLADSVQPFVTYLVHVGLLAVFVAAAVGSVFALFKVPAFVTRRAIERALAPIRRRDFFGRGMQPSKTTLKRELRLESDELFACFVLSPAERQAEGLPRWYWPEPWTFKIADDAVSRLRVPYPDRDDDGLREIAGQLRKLAAPVTQRVSTLVYGTALLVAAVLAHGGHVDTFAYLRSIDPVRETFQLPGEWTSIFSYYIDGIAWSEVAGIWISAIVMMIAAGWIFRRFYRAAFGIAAPPVVAPDAAAEDSDQDMEAAEEGARLGNEGCTVRTLSFAGGAFDTIMQIGVAHALLTIQGRAPDAVVGISGGAVNAVALAEIIQAGEDYEREAIRRALGEPGATITRDNIGAYWRKLPDKERQNIQWHRRAARVNELRKKIEAAQQAPEKLFEALLPDPYQIESTNPLHPLEQPRFAPKERIARAEAARRRSGLVRLYNDLLNIPFSIGTLVRATRRVLGIRAAGEITDKRLRRAVYVVEAVRLWVLIGVNLVYAAPLGWVLLRTFGRPWRSSTAIAGNLIFRFRSLDRLAEFAKNGLSFLVLLAMWVAGTLLPFSLGHLVAWGLFSFGRALDIALADNTGYQTAFAWITTFTLYGVVVLPSVLTRGQLTELERSTVSDLVKGVFKTASILVALTVVWTLVLFGWPHAILMLVGGWYWPVDLLDWEHNGVYAALALLIPWLLAGLLYWSATSDRRSFGDRLLRSYNLHDAILRVHGLRTFLADVFDPDYYDKAAMDVVVEESLQDKIRFEGEGRGRKQKQIGRYSAKERLEPVHVGVTVANTATGKLDVVGSDVPVVKALIAGLSFTPLFRPVRIGDHLYINGSNVANEPTRALLRYLRKTLTRNAGPIQIYSVSPFPLSAAGIGKLPARADDGGEKNEDEAWPDAPRAVLNLVDVAVQALRLQRYRDATLERRLTELISRNLEPGENDVRVPNGKGDHDLRFLRAWITPIELDHAVNTNARLIGAGKTTRRERILQTISDGCRASMQVMLGDAIEKTVKPPKGSKCKPVGTSRVEDEKVTDFIAPCCSAVKTHLLARGPEEEWANQRLPGSEENIGPGLGEVCRYCRIWRGDDSLPEPRLAEFNVAHLRQRQVWEDRGPAWPHEREYAPDKPGQAAAADGKKPEADPHFVREAPERKLETREALKSIRTEMPLTREGLDDAGRGRTWPLDRKPETGSASVNGKGVLPGNDRPVLSFLFSGGVFRGVYQMGVLTALNQLGRKLEGSESRKGAGELDQRELHPVSMKPDVIAGASVGSITAAMIAETFSIPDDKLRHARIAQLAAVYLAVDRIIMTDRFADFVRDLTLRAAGTRFSIRQADRLLRKYDHPNLREFDRNARAVIAGLERLLYINPYQLNELVKNIRNGDYGKVLSLLRVLGQQVLDRLLVGDEVLGTEALVELIDAYVTNGRKAANPVGLQFDDLRRQSGIQILATTTNLARGSLEILGECPGYAGDDGQSSPILTEGLLASSAFPGVFRPRWSWELYPDTSVAEQYIDGGVMDNLPVDAVAQFLYGAYKAGLISRRPRQGPHLVVAASLQVNAREYAASVPKRLGESWLALRGRAKELQYNSKLDIYCETQAAMRRIVEHYEKRTGARKRSKEDDSSKLETLNIEVVPIKPNQLCSTFAFHPMLGFKRSSQKESIAHGCASTLLKFGDLKKSRSKAAYLDAWGVDHEWVPPYSEWIEAFDAVGDKEAFKSKGLCWLTAQRCPFAKDELEKVRTDDMGREILRATTIEEVAEIHRLCMMPETHLRPV